jgi:hypothetical protein
VWQAIRRDAARGEAGPPGQSAQSGPSRQAPARGAAPASSPRTAAPSIKLQPIEMNLVSLCGDHPGLLADLPDELLDHLGDPVLAEMLREGREMAKEGDVSAHQLVELAPPELRPAVVQAALSGLFSRLDQPAVALEDIGKELRVRSLQREEKEIKDLLRRATADQDNERLQALMRRLMEIQQTPELRSRKRDPHSPSGLT